jgi:hypothetical protein
MHEDFRDQLLRATSAEAILGADMLDTRS